MHFIVSIFVVIYTGNLSFCVGIFVVIVIVNGEVCWNFLRRYSYRTVTIRLNTNAETDELETSLELRSSGKVIQEYYTNVYIVCS